MSERRDWWTRPKGECPVCGQPNDEAAGLSIFCASCEALVRQEWKASINSACFCAAAAPGKRKQTSPAPAGGLILEDKYWSDPFAPNRWLHLLVIGLAGGTDYRALITLGADRGAGFGLAELAQVTTRQLEAAFHLAAARCPVRWAVRLLSPSVSGEPAGPGGGIARMDHFRVVETRTGHRIAVAIPESDLAGLFEVVVPPPPKPPRRPFHF